MSNTSQRSTLLVAPSVNRASDRRRWYTLRYLRECTYPATVTEMSEYVAPRLGTASEDVENALRDDDLPSLAECDAIKYDPRSELACLADERESFAEHARRAIVAGAISHLKPPNHKLTRTAPSPDI